MDEQELLDMLERQNQLLEKDNRAVSFERTSPQLDSAVAGSEASKRRCGSDSGPLQEQHIAEQQLLQHGQNGPRRHAMRRSASADPAVKVKERMASTSSSSSQLQHHQQQQAENGKQEEAADPEVERFMLWTEILSNWDTWYRKKQRRLLDLLYEGVPGALRCVVWQHLARSQQQASEVSAARLHTDNAPSYAELIAQDTPHDKLIQQDLARTFPKHHKFKDKQGDGQEVLYNVMKAYSLYDTEVGYCQGSAFIVAILLMHMPEEEAFDLFIILMRDYRLRGMFKPSMADLPLRLHQFDALIRATFPDLHAHFGDLGLAPSMYASQWFLTAFTSSLHTEAAFRLFDVFLLEGIPLLFKAGLAILHTNHNLLHRHNFDGVMTVLGRDGLQQRYVGAEEELLHATKAAAVTQKQLQRYEKQYHTEKKEEEERTSELARLRDKCHRLEQRNAALEAQLGTLEGDYNKLAKKHLDVSVQLHQRDEQLLDMQEQLRRLMDAHVSLSSDTAVAEGKQAADDGGDSVVDGSLETSTRTENSDEQGQVERDASVDGDQQSGGDNGEGNGHVAANKDGAEKQKTLKGCREEENQQGDQGGGHEQEAKA
ncbi:hypothetical protein PTSG_12425 [Salpingoeca rosetta]|uniref:Rab-GAP TBC domain-containing protein n=1 Tax=Salpingoeca rosetta (strain ATCC 50818 / BSB-021) TaxID=946362 RepID=F2UCH4_SALR5|nr:uncharacterized protein PTSG_12425 [Salpingoeca rosetta]EGD74281.1 hypothetical protein PTSG_12425 [Salpingoeca rosetta]|eukprot:XP_004993181.1 hypothetical protein PTSG_12425 [Salpingoeca rosetta]